MRRLVPERLCLMLGSALVLAAVCLYVYDRLEDARAGAQAASAVSQLRQSQSIAAASEAEQPADSAESLPTEDAESEPEPASEPPASSIEREYLGVLTIPALGLELPVQTRVEQGEPQGLALPSMRQCGGRRPCHRGPQLQVPFRAAEQPFRGRRGAFHFTGRR